MTIKPSNSFNDGKILKYSPSKKFKSYLWSNKDFSIEELYSQVIDLNSARDMINLDFRIGFEIYNSNKIEGNKLDRIETKMILEDKVIPEDSSYRDVVECINLGTTIEDYRVLDNIDLNIILDIHRSITNGLLSKSEKGKIRTGSVFITNSTHVPPSSDVVELKLSKAIERFNSSNKTIIDVFILKLDLVTIHPFTDGNGRTSRVIMNGLLEGLGFPRIIITASDKKFYYDALENTNSRFDKNYWIKYCLILMKYNIEFLYSTETMI